MTQPMTGYKISMQYQLRPLGTLVVKDTETDNSMQYQL